MNIADATQIRPVIEDLPQDILQILSFCKVF